MAAVAAKAGGPVSGAGGGPYYSGAGSVVRVVGGFNRSSQHLHMEVGEAQVHAAPALAAATALGNVELREWREMAGTRLNDPRAVSAGSRARAR
jgi:hypothetical protein